MIAIFVGLLSDLFVFIPSDELSHEQQPAKMTSRWRSVLADDLCWSGRSAVAALVSCTDIQLFHQPKVFHREEKCSYYIYGKMKSTRKKARLGSVCYMHVDGKIFFPRLLGFPAFLYFYCWVDDEERTKWKW
jgi:hypothetical protein